MSSAASIALLFSLVAAARGQRRVLPREARELRTAGPQSETGLGTGRDRRCRLRRGYHLAMCGRFSQAESSRRLAAIFGAELDGDLPDGKHNVAPTDQIRIVVERRAERLLTAADWGFRPF